MPEIRLRCLAHTEVAAGQEGVRVWVSEGGSPPTKHNRDVCRQGKPRQTKHKRERKKPNLSPHSEFDLEAKFFVVLYVYACCVWEGIHLQTVGFDSLRSICFLPRKLLTFSILLFLRFHSWNLHPLHRKCASMPLFAFLAFVLSVALFRTVLAIPVAKAVQRPWRFFFTGGE